MCGGGVNAMHKRLSEIRIYTLYCNYIFSAYSI
jgi:hypothetical protein